MLNAAVGYQLVDDGTPLSVGLIFGSAAAIFVAAGYIALDTGFNWTGYWQSTVLGPTETMGSILPTNPPNRNYALYTFYQLIPLVFLFVYFVLSTVLVLRVLGERRPMRKLEPFTLPKNFH